MKSTDSDATTAVDDSATLVSKDLVKIAECENCHQALNGPFCANCGQEADSTLKYFWVVLLHLLDDIFSFDSRASRTLWPLMFRPGFLTNEYFAGRRVHYVPPIRLYLFISIVFFITLKFFVAAESDTLNLNDKQSVIIEVKSHLEKLQADKKKIEKVALQSAAQTATKSTETLLTLNEDIAKFTEYLTDLNRDYSVGNNKQVIKITRELVELEFEKVKADLPEDKKTRFDELLTDRLKAQSGELVEEEKQEVTFSNNAEGTLSFDFLSKEQNKKLNTFGDELAQKIEKAFNSDTGPLVQQTISKLPQLMFILLPLFAVLLKVMFLFSKRLYMEHLTVALHSHSFIFIAIFLSEILDVAHDYFAVSHTGLASVIYFIAAVVTFWIPVYLFIMQKRVYRQGYFFTFVKFGIIGTMYTVLIMFTGLVAVVWGVMGT